MKQRLLIMIMAGLWFFSLLGYQVRAAELKKKHLPDNQTIEITSDRLEAYDEKKQVLFSGNVGAVQGDITIKAASIRLYYKKEGRSGDKDGLQNVGKAGDLEKIEARGQVKVSQGDRLVTGDQAIYYQEARRRIVMTGDAVMRQGNNVVRGDRIEVFLDENRGIVEAGENKRVKATIYPRENKEEEKKGR
jgi:lipopolysaccharide export system protein LptA